MAKKETNTLKPVYRKVKERYDVGPSLSVDYTIDSEGQKYVKISYLPDKPINGKAPFTWVYAEGSSMNYPLDKSADSPRTILPGCLEKELDKLPLKVRKVMGRTK